MSDAMQKARARIIEQAFRMVREQHPDMLEEQFTALVWEALNAPSHWDPPTWEELGDEDD